MENEAGQFIIKRSRYVFKWLFCLTLIIAGVLWLFGQQLYVAATARGYQAVFLTNGQVYFGKLSATGHWIKLTDIYYLQAQQAQQSLQQTTTDSTSNAQSPDAETAQVAGSSAQSGSQPQTNQPQISLVKLGEELHGPTDVMYIDRDKVLFWENLKDDSKVVSAIKSK